jgi:predicted PurR-regulated permease PerM
MENEQLRLIRRAGVVLALGTLALAVWLLLWYAIEFVLLVFAGVLLAIMLDVFASLTERHVPLPHRWALAAVIVFLLSVGALAVRFTGPQLAEQLVDLAGRLPQAAMDLRDDLWNRPWGRFLVRQVSDGAGDMARPSELIGRITGIFSTTLGVVANLIIIVFLGVYLAADGGRYRGALLLLIPCGWQARANELLSATRNALGRWILARLASMGIVTVLTATALWLLGVPLVLGLSLLAGLFTFVPYVGPLLSAVPAVLIGWMERPSLALWVAIAYAAVQFLESYIITPMVEDRALSMPPAVLLSAQILMGLAAGILGVLLASPLAVVVIVLVQLLYVRGVLGHDVEPLGSNGSARTG